jgi:predicted Zn-ribbon and HTH transcriptional regulator
MVRCRMPMDDKTARQRILSLISGGWFSLREISHAAGVSEKDALDHLAHIERSLRERKGLEVQPGQCESCGFVFRKRGRLSRPGRCPVCRATHIRGPRFHARPGGIPSEP